MFLLSTSHFFWKTRGKMICGLSSRNGVMLRRYSSQKNINRSDRRYGFVRFIWVDDVKKHERQLDNLILGGLNYMRIS